MDNKLAALARMKSQDMLSNNYFAHTSPTLGNAATMLRNNGYSFNSVGENISKHSTVIKSHAALMSSDGHRRNILNSSWQKVGIGIVLDGNGSVYMTQLFVR
ncbi:MAG: CAP domain-containing protein [Clostridia bacterium]|nr:CAP domain-containing protein [Clostridia bacterium]